MIKLEDKLYTSTEVATILGVSLRSVYRYIEDSKLNPEVKTATGRHRFTKQNIVEFLYPEGEKESSRNVEEDNEGVVETKKVAKIKSEKAKTMPKVLEEEDTSEKTETPPLKTEAKSEDAQSEPIDWLAKFREAAKKFEEEPAKEKFTGLADEEVAVKVNDNKYYYRSKLGGLKDIAQNIDKSLKNSGSEYAFTMNSGLSLHSPIKPFSMLHVYVKSKDKDFFERTLMLTPTDPDNAQLCLLVSDDSKLYANSVVMHGLVVASKEKLLSDIREMDVEGSLTKEAESILG